jgi:hypothetical protein
MTTLNLDKIKETFKDSIRTYLYPYQESYASSISIYNSGNVINQPVSLFSTAFNTIGVYVNSIIGTPSPLILSFLKGNVSVYSSTIASTVGWNYVTNVNQTFLNSNKDYTIRLSCECDADNDYYIGKDSSNTYYFNKEAEQAIAFTIPIRDFVYSVFPAEEVTNERLPVVVVDISGKPKSDDRYLSGSHIWYHINVKIDVYSKYPSEVDKLVSGIDRGIMKDRKTFSEINYISSGNITELGQVAPNLYTRAITYSIRQLIATE